MQSAEGQAGSQRASVSGASENVQEGIDSAADTVKEGTRQAQEYAEDPEKACFCLSFTGVYTFTLALQSLPSCKHSQQNSNRRALKDESKFKKSSLAVVTSDTSSLNLKG